MACLTKPHILSPPTVDTSSASACVLVQGHLPPEQCKQTSVLCAMMDLLVKCDSAEMIRALCAGLSRQPDLPGSAGASKRTRKSVSKKRGKGDASEDASLDVRTLLDVPVSGLLCTEMHAESALKPPPLRLADCESQSCDELHLALDND
jgi:hypothetical protein